MSEDLIDVGDDFWNHPSLLQYATISPSNNNNTSTHQNTNNSTNNSSNSNHSYSQNPRKRKFNEIHASNTLNNYYNTNNNYSNKRSKITSNTTHSSWNSINQHNDNNNNNNNNNTTRYEPAPECHHKLPMTKRITRKQGKNHGRAFWCCCQSSADQCKSFKWDDQWRREQKNLNINTLTHAPHQSFLLSTELICIEPIALVEVSIHPPEPYFVEQVKKCNNAQWNPDKRKWVIPLDQHKQLIQYTKHTCQQQEYIFKMDVIPSEILRNVNKWINHKKQQNKERDSMDDCLDALPLKLRSKLYEFQKEGIKFAINKGGRCLLADEMGLGKSIQAIGIAYYYQTEWPLLIITPSSLTLTWKMEILKWLSPIIRECDINRIRKTSDKLLSYDNNINMNKPLKPITIISYGLAIRKQAEISDHNKLFGIVICDESHALKNYKTQRCKILLPLIKNNIKYCLLLSGTPTNNRPSELWTQIDALRPNNFLSFKQYSIRYCEGQHTKFGWQANGAMHLKELHSIIKYKVMIRRTKKEVLTQLPDKIRTVISIECDKKLEKKIKQKLQQSEALKDEMEQIEMSNDNENNNIDENNAVFDKKNKTMLELYSLTGMSKINKIKEYICDLYANDEKFLIFGHHLQVLDGIQECVEQKCKCGFIRIDGSTSSDKRQLLVDKFQKDESIRIAILSITAAGVGLTLTAATSVVFAELYWGPTALLQCEDRAHRIGQKSTVNIIYLLGKGSLDDQMWPMIKKKMEVISKTLTGKHIKMEVEQYKQQYIKQITPHKNNNNNNRSTNHNIENKSNGNQYKTQKKITSMLTFTPITHSKKKT